MATQINDNVVPTFICACCGEEMPTSYAHDTTDGKVCSACLNFWYAKCDHCGDWTSDGVSVDGETWCEDCVNADAAWCEHCETCHEKTTSVLVRYDQSGRHYEEWCEDCVENDAATCDDCGTVFSRGGDGGFCDCDVCDRGYVDLCSVCLHAYYTCDECGQLVHEDDMCESGGRFYCPDCCPDNVDGALESYHHTYAHTFFGDGPLYVGVELETEADQPGTMARDIIDAAPRGFVECKRDSSLNGGCEIVSQPASPACHLDGAWDDIVQVCRDHGAQSHDGGRCGLHVHINRTYLACGKSESYRNEVSDAAAYVMDTILSHHPAEWLRFSRRSEDSMRQWARIDGSPDADKQTFSVWKSKKCGRYCAINTSNSETVEIRLWRGTLRRESFRATLQASAALAIIARNYRAEVVRTWTWEQVKRHLYAALAVYGIDHTDLKNYMDYRGL